MTRLLKDGDTVRLRATVTYTVEYDASAENYLAYSASGEITAEEMAAMDTEALRDGEITLWDHPDAVESSVGVSVVQPERES